MQKVTILCVGKLKERFYQDAAAEYAKRLGRHCRLELVELPEQRLPDAPSQGEIDAALAREAAAIRERLPKAGALVALCVEGWCAIGQDVRSVSGYSISIIGDRQPVFNRFFLCKASLILNRHFIAERNWIV